MAAWRGAVAPWILIPFEIILAFTFSTKLKYRSFCFFLTRTNRAAMQTGRDSELYSYANCDIPPNIPVRLIMAEKFILMNQQRG
jgi:hypothetical protein